MDEGWMDDQVLLPNKQTNKQEPFIETTLPNKLLSKFYDQASNLLQQQTTTIDVTAEPNTQVFHTAHTQHT